MFDPYAAVMHYCNFAGFKQEKWVLSSGGQESESGVDRAVLLLEALGGPLFLALPASSSCWIPGHSLACVCITPVLSLCSYCLPCVPQMFLCSLLQIHL